MKINSLNFYNSQNPSFAGRGKPLDLNYIVNKRAKLLPKRVLETAILELKKDKSQQRSLLEIHKSVYSKLSSCLNLEMIKSHFPEFEGIKDSVVFSRDSVYKRDFEFRTIGINFPLKMIQDLWLKLKSKDEVAQELGMKSRTSLDWALKRIEFVYFPTNYRTLLKASDEVGNSLIAQKTKDWNAAHPELMMKRNKHAAQFCKTDSYRSAQSKRMLEYDKNNPERREKIAESSKRAWGLCPEIKEAMASFAAGESVFVRNAVIKNNIGITLSTTEFRAVKGFYKRFWNTFPELKRVFAEAMRKEN